jgi:spermidine synthase
MAAMLAPAPRIAPLLFLSGLCALIYQVAWQRDLRLVFGASTAASAAVLAVFIGGLGLGSVFLGRRAERHPRPILLYSSLEGLIALSTAATPALLWLCQHLYVATGGRLALGTFLDTALRLLLTAVVLGVPTFLMGGTLPAAARGVTTADDLSRRRLARLYGWNTLGAVTGAALATFLLLEILGTRRTLWVACLVNLLVAVTARSIGRKAAPLPAAADAAPPAAPAPAASAPAAAAVAPPAAALPAAPPASPLLVLGAAALVGFAFFLMELVWYRLLGPLLGGTVFTFGMILAVALLGIGVGGAWYSVSFAHRPATLRAFALTCLLEALALAVPFALGDRLAVVTVLLRPLGALGFGGFIAGWFVVAGIVVLPAAVVAGVQFPLLIALLGRGARDVGRHVGLAYAWNTAGAMGGSLAGGFGLLPLLGAPGCWRLCATMLVVLGLGAVLLSARRERRLAGLLAPLGAAVATALLLGATGPTAAWRHSDIGVGRVAPAAVGTPLAVRDFVNSRRRHIIWETEGVESSVALSSQSGLAFYINGKVDGNSRHDAATQVMAPLVGGLLHPGPRRALVIGLGTGSSAGWLAADPRLEAVDAVELEPAMVEVARRCAPVNHDALRNPRLRLVFGDAREVLLTAKQPYDLVVSEPSNPYRAGIASLFTREYYQAVARRLRPGGMFLQWVQAYEVDAQTVRTVYATLASVFPHVETWQLRLNDLLMVASMEPIVHDAETLRARLGTEPFRSGLRSAWRVTDLEGLYGHYVARPELARAVAAAEGPYLNTDDQTIVEFGFARSLGRDTNFATSSVRRAAQARGLDLPAVRGALDLDRVVEARAGAFLDFEAPPDAASARDEAQRLRLQALGAGVRGDLAEVARLWRRQPRAPESLHEITLVAEALADLGDEAAAPLVERLRPDAPVEADAILARLRWRQQRVDDAAALLDTAFRRFRDDPWPWPLVMRRAIHLAEQVGRRDQTAARRLYQALREPFAVMSLNDARQGRLLALAALLPPGRECVDALAPYEPFVDWDRELLEFRQRCYTAVGDRRAARAARDLEELKRLLPAAFGRGLPRPEPPRP